MGKIFRSSLKLLGISLIGVTSFNLYHNKDTRNNSN